MFQEMINGSIAVLTKPSVATFEEHEKDNLAWALIYSVIAGLLNAIVAAIGAAIGLGVTNLPNTDPAMAEAMRPGIGSIIGGGIFGTIIGLLIAWGLTYILGRAFGGTGTFGELAWGLSLFSAPLTIVSGIVGLIPFIGPIAVLGLVGYNFYLTYLAIQSGMNLPPNKALYVILIQLAIVIGIVACICAVAGTAIMAIMGASSSGQ